ncbi:MAG: hypothetical protein ACK4F9_03815 [Brevinematia bacterium]
MFRYFHVFIVVFFIVFFSFLHSYGQKMPEWVTTPTFKKGKDVYFVGMGKDKDIILARNKAIDDIKTKFVESILVDVVAQTKSETLITSQGSEIDVAQNIRKEIQVQGRARIYVPTPEDEVSFQDKDGTYTVYMLVKYPESKILEERQRIEQIYKDMIRSVDKFVEEGDKFVKEGKLVNAIASYTLAAKNSLAVEERKMFYPEIIKKMDDIISRLSIEVIEGNNKKVKVGDSGEIKFRVYYNYEGQKIPVKDANLIFRVSSGAAEITTSGTSDDQGVVVCNVSRVLKFENRKLSISAFPSLDFSALSLISPETKRDASKLFVRSKNIRAEANWTMDVSKSRNAVIIVVSSKGSKYLYDQALSSSLSSYVTKKGYNISKPISTSIASDDFSQIKRYLPKDSILVLVKVSEPEQKEIEWGGEKETRVEIETSIEIYDADGYLINSGNYKFSSSSLSTMRSNLPKNIGGKIEELDF